MTTRVDVFRAEMIDAEWSDIFRVGLNALESRHQIIDAHLDPILAS